MYILFKESNINCELCLGEVQTGQQYFDHSWIQIEEKIYDAAISMPLSGGKIHPPVYASIDLKTNKLTTLGYGLLSGAGLGQEAMYASGLNLTNYAKTNNDELWKLSKQIGKECGIKINIGKIKEKYGEVKRLVI